MVQRHELPAPPDDFPDEWAGYTSLSQNNAKVVGLGRRGHSATIINNSHLVVVGGLVQEEITYCISPPEHMIVALEISTWTWQKVSLDAHCSEIMPGGAALAHHAAVELEPRVATLL